MNIFIALVNTYQKTSTEEGPLNHKVDSLSPQSWHNELVSGVATVAEMEATRKANGVDSHSVGLT